MDTSRLLHLIRCGHPDPFHAALYHKKGSAPPAPDYTGAAEKTAQSSKEVVNMQTWANRPEQETPWGTQSWETEAVIDPATGQPVTKWKQITTLSPEQQAAEDAQQAITMGRSQAAQTLLGQAIGGFDKPFDWSNLAEAPENAAKAGNVTDAQNAAYQQLSQMLQPGRSQQQAALDTKLANMGLPSYGSEANRRANMQLSDQWATQDRQMMQAAMEQGRANVGQQYQMDQSQVDAQERLRGQQIAEQIQQRGMSLNELNALLTGQQVAMPSMPGFNTAQSSQATDYSGAAKAMGDYGLASTKLANDAAAAQMQAATSMAGSAASMF